MSSFICFLSSPLGFAAVEFSAADLKQTRSLHGNKTATHSDLSGHYREIGIKAVAAAVRKMCSDEIRVDHCYSMAPINGRRTIARVTKLFNITAMAAYEDVKRGGTESLTINPTVVRFVWRHASYPTGWSKSQQQLLLDEFALAAEEDVASS